MQQPVHPRACGEQIVPWVPTPRPSSSVHPRACGEQKIVTLGAVIQFIVGSSPRLRGTDDEPVEEAIRREVSVHPRACGEQPDPPICNGTRSPVHPRACGEQFADDQASRQGLDRGSSPRLRGTGLEAEQKRSIERFIPAPAGNRPRESCYEHPESVHPRACGEQIQHSHIDRVRQENGSSPRLRGTGCALQLAAWRDAPVHPRACGEQGHASFWPLPMSITVHPRACGEQLGHEGQRQRPFIRFIPAPAGNSSEADDTA